MDTRWTTRVRKRDGSLERFDSRKLAAAIWRAMRNPDDRYRDAWNLAEAIRIHLARKRVRTIAGGAIFEMTLRVLQRVRFDDAAEELAEQRYRRCAARARLRLRIGERTAPWDKTLLIRHARRRWRLSRSAARLLAGEVERDLLENAPGPDLPDTEVLEALDRRVAEFGLADAVPVK